MSLTRSEVRRLFSFLTEIKVKRVYLLILAISVAHLGFGVLLGFIPTLSTKYFASTSEDGKFARCVDQLEGEEPRKVCKEAHTMAAFWDAGKLLLSNLFLAILINASVRRYSITYGRKPFLILALLMSLVPPVIVLLHLQANMPFFWFYLAKAAELSFSLSSISYAYLSDLVEETAVDMVYVVYLTAVSFSSFLGALLVAAGALDDVLHAVIFTLSCIGASIAFLILFVPESVSRSSLHSSSFASDEVTLEINRTAYDHWVRPFQEMYTSFCIHVENLNVIYMLMVYAVFEVINQRDSELELQYLQEVAGFGTREQSTFLMIRFLVTSFVYAILFPVWTLLINKTYKDAFGVGFILAGVKLFGMIFVTSPRTAYFLEACGAVDALVNLMIYRVIEHHEESGGSHGLAAAVMGIRSFAQGLSPLFHAFLFAVFRHMGGYFPGAPFVSLFVLAVIGFTQVLNIRIQKHGVLIPASTFLRLVTLTFFSEDEDFDDCMNRFGASERGYMSEDDNGSKESYEDDESPSIAFLQARFG